MKNKLFKILTGIIAIFLLGNFAPAFAQESTQAIPDTFVAFPESANVSLRWIVPPSKDQDFSAVQFIRQHQNLCFSMDAQETAWIGFDSRLICPTKRLVFALSEPFQQFIHLNNGAMMISTAAQLGLAQPEEIVSEDYAGLQIVPYQPFTTLPKTFARIFSAGQALYAISDEPSGGSIVFLLAPEEGQAAKLSAVRRWVKLFSTEKRIDALTGDGKITLFTNGNMVFFHQSSSNSIGSLQAALPENETVRQLARTSKGLYYATDHEVGIIGTYQSHKLVETPFPKINAREDKLFVLFPNCMGVAAFDNLQGLEAIY